MAVANTPPVHDVVCRNVSEAMPQAQIARIDEAGHDDTRNSPLEFNRLSLSFLRRYRLLR